MASEDTANITVNVEVLDESNIAGRMMAQAPQTRSAVICRGGLLLLCSLMLPLI